MTPELILIAQDHGLARRLRSALEQAGYRVRSEAGEPAPPLMADLILLAPKDGLSAVVSRWREAASPIDTPLLVWLPDLKAAAAMLREGADDCVAASADSGELLARIDRLLARRGILASGRVRIDPVRGRADIGRGEVALTAQELRLLRYLACRAGAAVARGELLREVGGYAAGMDTRTVDAHIASLRRKLEVDPHRPEHLVTIRGCGYRFDHVLSDRKEPFAKLPAT